MKKTYINPQTETEVLTLYPSILNGIQGGISDNNENARAPERTEPF